MAPPWSRFLPRRRLGGLGLAIALVGVSVGMADAAPPPKPQQISWAPVALGLTVVRGTISGASAVLTAAKRLPNVTISASGDAAAFVTLSPTSLSSVAAASPVTVSMVVSVPGTAATGDYLGSVLVSSGKKAIADSLPFTLHVVDPTGHIYWAASGLNTLGRSDRDGSNADAAFMPTTPSVGVAADAQYLYWTDVNSQSIGRANLDGTSPDPNFIGVPGPYGIAVDDSFIYWTDAQSQSIGRANLDGTGVQSILIATGSQSLPYGLAVDGQHIYWTDNAVGGSIHRADLDGSNPSAIVLGTGALGGVALDASHMYWTDYHYNFTSSMGRADLDGSNPNPDFITGNSVMLGVAVDGQYLYWADYANYDQQGTGTIGRANLDGTNPDHSFILGAGNPYFIAVGN